MRDLQAAKDAVRAFYAALDSADGTDVTGVLARSCTADLVWRGYHPFHELTGPEAVAERFWRPLKSSLRHMQRRLDLFFAGRNEIDDGRSVWVASMGHLMGLFDAPWLGIRPTRRIESRITWRACGNVMP